MAQWTLLHTRSPLNTVAGSTGQWGELTRASSRKLTFGAEEPDTLTFDMPGNHAQTAAIVPLVSDVLAFRDDYPAQRFRVVSRQLSKADGVLKASFSAVSYRALLDAWIFHGDDMRSWPTPTEQTEIAWQILSQGQNRPFGKLGITRGVLPTTPVLRTRPASVPEGGGTPVEYFQSGMKRSEAIQNLADTLNGFEWDIQPDQADPYRALKFNTWNFDTRSQHATRSTLILDDGGSMSSWSHTITPTDYGNLVRVSGSENTDEGAVALASMWYPGNRIPVGTPQEGRWERDIINSDLTTQDAVTAYAYVAYDQAHKYVPEITCSLRRGRWKGPSQLWIGDKARLIITEPVADASGDFVIYVDEDVRVVEISIDVDDLGAEDISLSLNRPVSTTIRNARRVNDRLSRLERR